MQVTVKSVSRLHFGFLDLSGDLGRSYGSIGVALENPRTVVTVTKAEQLIIEDGGQANLVGFVEKFSRHYQVKPTVRIQVLDSIPEHSGLGSGTQLALVISTALAKICNIDADAQKISRVMGRGRRSGIGIASFHCGGFIIDSGRKSLGREDLVIPPKVVFRHDFPTDWGFVIVIPEGQKGLSGKEEERVMSRLEPSRKLSEEICRLTQIKLLPSLIDRDIEEFGAALTEIDLRTGMFFQKAQVGIYSGEMTRNLVEFILRCGAYGAGQSSWGPAVYGLVDKARAEGVVESVKDFFSRKNICGKVFVSRCSNKGAEVTVKDSLSGRRYPRSDGATHAVEI